jgi:hypothetical protein
MKKRTRCRRKAARRTNHLATLHPTRSQKKISYLRGGGGDRGQGKASRPRRTSHEAGGWGGSRGGSVTVWTVDTAQLILYLLRPTRIEDEI